MEWRLSPAPKPETRRRLKRRWGSCAPGSLRATPLAQVQAGAKGRPSGGRSPRDEDMRPCPQVAGDVFRAAWARGHQVVGRGLIAGVDGRSPSDP